MRNFTDGTRPLSSLIFYLLVLALFLISFLGLFIPIMEVDASQYASMSQEMINSKSWLCVKDLGQDYLDKPPLLFWLSSLSIFIFGHSSWAFKLPSFIMAWASVYFLFRLVKLYYPLGIAQLAALVYASSVAFILFTNDIRTDTLLISFVILAVWQLANYIEHLHFKNLCIGSIALGLAMLAKGPIGLVVPVLALAPHLLLKGKIKVLLQWKNVLAPLIILLVLSPMLLGLYEQWGAHGIRFFFWEQSFGRITGENVWANDATHFYFLHNIAWAFLPFTVFLLSGLLYFGIHFKNQREYISFFGFILPFIALSFSQYKLPHYIYIVIPFAAIISANYISNWRRERGKMDSLISIFQTIIILALFLTGLVLIYFFEAKLWYFIYIPIMGLILFLGLALCQLKSFLIYASFLAFLTTSLVLNGLAYPKLLQYQSSSEAALYISHENKASLPVYQLNIWWRAFHYYSGGIVPEFSDNTMLENKAVLVFTNQEGFLALKENYTVILVKEFPQFSVTRLSFNFLNPKTRAQTLSFNYLLKIQKKP
jgi:4-amino-4-deoxy-L-arabinose transferase-like glycosyltransferase